MFAESLTVRILADSSHFRADLDALVSLLGRMRESAQAVADGGSAIGDSFSQLTRAVTPLQQVGKLLSTIQNQLRAISQTPLLINIDMAMASLAQLSSMIDLVAAKLNALSSAGSGGGMGGATGGGGNFGGGVSPLAPGGPLSFPPKLSVMASSSGSTTAQANFTAPAAVASNSPMLPSGWGVMAAAIGRLTQSPQVIERPARLPPTTTASVPLSPGTTTSSASPLAESLRMTPPESRRAVEPAPHSTSSSVTTHSSSTHNHFGGITINVRETADVNSLVRDLRLQGIHLRNRRG